MNVEERIVAAALRAIGEHGMAGTSMSAVADAAGVSRQTVYNHFPDIDSMVVAAIEEHERASAEHLELVLSSATHPGTRLELLIRHGLAVSGHAGSSPLAGVSPQARAGLEKHRQAHTDAIAGVLSDGIDAGVFRGDLDIPATAHLIQVLIVGGPSGGDPGALADAALALLTNGVFAAAG